MQTDFDNSDYVNGIGGLEIGYEQAERISDIRKIKNITDQVLYGKSKPMQKWDRQKEFNKRVPVENLTRMSKKQKRLAKKGV